jgi:hypothetical protein
MCRNPKCSIELCLSWGQGQNDQFGSFILIKRNMVVNESIDHCYNVRVEKPNIFFLRIREA